MRTDTFGRWGGEEFIIICDETDLDSAIALAHQLRLNVEKETFPTVGRKTASFGVATYHKGDGADDIIKRADDALYRAKKHGRNQVVEEKNSNDSDRS